MTPLKICIVGLKCYDHIAGAEVPRFLGGIETQLTVLAKGLASTGCEVSLITYDHGQPDGEVFDGVRVWKSCRPDGGIRILRSIHPRATGLWAAMRRANADVYLQMGAGLETGLVARGCRRVSGEARKFVFCLASDADTSAKMKAGPLGLEGLAYLHGLRGADLIVCQTQRQENSLRVATRLESVIIPMGVVPRTTAERTEGVGDHVLWIGRITEGKRLEWLLRAAKKLPAVTFHVVGTPNRDSDYSLRVMAEARRIKNVVVHGRVSNDELVPIFNMCKVLCCTSELEGFPTTFLEAWACAIPVVTTFDPDGLVQKRGLGTVSKSETDLVRQLKHILHERQFRQQLSETAHAYFIENHSLSRIAAQFVDVFGTVVLTPTKSQKPPANLAERISEAPRSGAER